MAVRVDDLPALALPAGIRVEPVVDERGAMAIAYVEQVGFGSEQEIADRFYAVASYCGESALSFVAWDGDEPCRRGGRVPACECDRDLRCRCRPAARRRGIAAALSVISARAFPADLAWLHTSDDAARAVYERLGFREVAEWEVWVRSA